MKRLPALLLLLIAGFSLKSQIHQDTLQASACDSYSWRGNNYFSSGWYQDSVFDNNGVLDSLLHLNLSLHYSTNNYYNVYGCDSVIFRGLSYFNGGYVVDSLSSIHGCDSIEEYFIYVETLDRSIITNGFTAMASQSNADYQWFDCDNANQMIIGAISQTFDPQDYGLGAGNYGVHLETSNCIGSTACIYLQSIGLNEWTGPLPQIYPNPSAGEIKLAFFSPDEYEIEIFDAQGSLHNRLLLRNGCLSHSLMLPEKTGLYYIRIHNSSDEQWQQSILRR